MAHLIRLFLLSLLLLMAMNSHAQKSFSVYGELLGNGLNASVNIDYRLNSNKNGIGVRLGYALGSDINLIGMVNYLIGSEKHKLEVGAGVMNISRMLNDNILIENISKGLKLTGSVVYRYHADSGFLFRIGWTPIVADNSETLRFWLGTSVGWRF